MFVQETRAIAASHDKRIRDLGKGDGGGPSDGSSATPDSPGHKENFGPRSICLTIYGYVDDGGASDGFGSQSVADKLGDAPAEAGGKGVLGT